MTLATADLSAGLIFEQEPSQILDALLPLYLSSTLLRSLQVWPPAVWHQTLHARYTVASERPSCPRWLSGTLAGSLLVRRPPL